jgi:hypothetical protein
MALFDNVKPVGWIAFPKDELSFLDRNFDRMGSEFPSIGFRKAGKKRKRVKTRW